MKLTLKQKRLIVRMFKAGSTLRGLAEINISEFSVLSNEAGIKEVQYWFEQVLRDFMNGRFSLGKEVR